MQRRLFSLLAIPMVIAGAVRPRRAAHRPSARPGACSPASIDLDRHGSRRYRLRRPPRRRLAGRRRPPDLHARLWLLGRCATSTPTAMVDAGGVPVEPAGVRMGRIEFYPDTIPGNWGSYDALEHGRARRPPHLEPGRPGPQRAAAAVRCRTARSTTSARPPSATSPSPDGRLAGVRVPAREQGRHALARSTSRRAASSQWTAGYIWPGTYILELRRQRQPAARPRRACDLAPGVGRPHQPRGAELRPPRLPVLTVAHLTRTHVTGRGRVRHDIVVVAHPVEPAEQHGDRPGIVAQAVPGAGEQAELGVAVGRGELAGVARSARSRRRRRASRAAGGARTGGPRRSAGSGGTPGSTRRSTSGTPASGRRRSPGRARGTGGGARPSRRSRPAG